MKKTILLLAAIIGCMELMAQVDTVAINAGVNAASDLFWPDIVKWLGSGISIFFTVVFIVDRIITNIKWIPGNNTEQVIWFTIKSIVHVLAGKK